MLPISIIDLPTINSLHISPGQIVPQTLPLYLNILIEMAYKNTPLKQATPRICTLGIVQQKKKI